MKIARLLLLAIVLFTSCAQARVKVPDDYMEKFQEFKKKEKFVEDSVGFYPGIADEAMRPELSLKVNMAADDFLKLAQNGVTAEKEYQQAIKNGLVRFRENYMNLDTEDRERICRYFEELMDIVGLESSGGHLNNFMYGVGFID